MAKVDQPSTLEQPRPRYYSHPPSKLGNTFGKMGKRTWVLFRLREMRALTYSKIPRLACFNTTTFGCDSSITFHHIPISPPPSGTSPFHLVRYGNHNLHQVLQSISKTTKIKAVVLDFMNYTAKEVTTTLDIPTFYYYTSGAASLSVLLYYKTIIESKKREQCNYIDIPGFPRILKEELPSYP
ncbi:unnamed protein product [Lupinus luteus]|uniref:Uncharacterized protein n=1 Tax=Lupinus luteus TaxID=3873 RepID=A0AAV1YHJ8_LUPLU